MRTDDWLQQATGRLSTTGIDTARLDALVLLEDAMGMDRSRLLAHPENVIPNKIKNVLDGQIASRATHEPLAYIRGKTEFYGREFVVSAATLEPRPETETIIDFLKYYVGNPTLTSMSTVQDTQDGSQQDGKDQYLPHVTKSNKRDPEQLLNDSSNDRLRQDKNTQQVKHHVADIGAGCGAIGITAALEVPNVAVDMLELSPAAIKIGETNVIKFATGQNIIQSDLLAQAPREYDILLCNLPYVPDSYVLNTAAMFEPKVAIFGGPDGLDLYRRLFQQIDKLMRRPLLILCEALPPQHVGLALIASVHGYHTDRTDDFVQGFLLNL